MNMWIWIRMYEYECLCTDLQMLMVTIHDTMLNNAENWRRTARCWVSNPLYHSTGQLLSSHRNPYSRRFQEWIVVLWWMMMHKCCQSQIQQVLACLIQRTMFQQNAFQFWLTPMQSQEFIHKHAFEKFKDHELRENLLESRIIIISMMMILTWPSTARGIVIKIYMFKYSSHEAQILNMMI